VGCDVAVNVIYYSQLAYFQIIILKAVIQYLAIYTTASSRFIRTLNNSQICSTLNGNMLTSCPAKSTYLARTDEMLIIKNITQC
jgi:hypothetical protein